MKQELGFEELADRKALARERKKRQRMHQHGKSLKKTGQRAILRIAKVEKRTKIHRKK